MKLLLGRAEGLGLTFQSAALLPALVTPVLLPVVLRQERKTGCGPFLPPLLPRQCRLDLFPFRRQCSVVPVAKILSLIFFFGKHRRLST